MLHKNVGPRRTAEVAGKGRLPSPAPQADYDAAATFLSISYHGQATVILPQRPRTRLELQGMYDHYDDAKLWITVSCECEDG